MSYLDSFVLVSDRDKPFITLRDRSVTFSKSAIEKLNYSPYVHMYIDKKAKKVAFQEAENDEDAIAFYKEHTPLVSKEIKPANPKRNQP